MQLDLVDEMQWEDLVEFETLEEAGLEESRDDEPTHGHYRLVGQELPQDRFMRAEP